jgi:hypothetical protein
MVRYLLARAEEHESARVRRSSCKGILMHENETQYEIALSAKELRYLVSCGAALLQHIPEKSLATYTNLTKQEIIDFCEKVRDFMDKNNLDM